MKYRVLMYRMIYVSLEKTRELLVPPNPKLFDMATSTFLACASRGTKLKPTPTSGFSRFNVAGTAPYTDQYCTMLGKTKMVTSWMDKIEKSASRAPAAPSKCPTAPLVLLTVICDS